MPSSQYYQINEILELIIRIRPESLLEIGPGFGKYGYLSREYLELWDGREIYNEWKYQIDAIEAFESYVTPLQKSIYNNIYIGDALEILPAMNNHYGLILLVDVFEHFTHENGIRLLKTALSKADNVIICSPQHVNFQGDAFGNVFETHRFEWKRHHFNEFSPKFFIKHHSSLICCIGRDAPRVRNEYRKFHARMFVKKYFPFVRVFRKLLPH
jgi:hypothetical protein